MLHEVPTVYKVPQNFTSYTVI